MNGQEKAELESQSQLIRSELKAWESQWSSTHDGKKPGREDIKNNPDIGKCLNDYVYV
jgi:DNA replication regulator SLD2